MHQYGVTEDGYEIHFSMAGTYRTIEKTDYKYQNPLPNLNDFNKIESIIGVVPEKSFWEKLKIKLGL